LFVVRSYTLQSAKHGQQIEVRTLIGHWLMRPADPAGNVTLDDISTMKSLVLLGIAYPRKRDGLLTGRV
jgi:hypothetical protein